ncbi:MAG: hypothetical protein GX595_11690, partial [Lentisphaerae bacterium]|nr:hypothetical protein [Lentisphaerota bacterium]
SLVSAAAALAAADAALPSLTSGCYYTPARIAAGLENVRRFDWAREQRERILNRGDAIQYYLGPEVTAARDYAALADDDLWLLQPDTSIPRTYDLNENRAVCPVHGEEVRKVNVWCPWSIDPLGHPYQIRCPLGGEWYPSNAYHRGDMTGGAFPDDGTGCVYQGQRYHFLKEYAAMVYGTVVVPTLSSLSQAYLLTGDAGYAYKGALLMVRLATQYPNYGWDGTDFAHRENRFERTYLGPWNNEHPYYRGKKGGLVHDLIWENIHLERIALAYDALRETIAGDARLLAYVQGKGVPVANGEDLRAYVEDYILRAGAQAILAGHLRGNEGHHQTAAMAVAVALDDVSERHPNSLDLVDWAYHGAGATAHILINGLSRDGGGHESPNYNRIKFSFLRLARLAECLRARHPEVLTAERCPDLLAHPKGRALFDHAIDILVADCLYPDIGDNGGIAAPRRRLDAVKHAAMGHEFVEAFRRWGDPRYARAAVDLSTGEFHPAPLWEQFPLEALRAALAEPSSEIRRGTRLIDGYGVAFLESGAGPHRRSAVLNASSIVGHRQDDQLALWLHAFGLDVLPDIGYPKTWDYAAPWDRNSMAHNTVTINERPFTTPRFYGNGTRFIAERRGVHAVCAFHDPYIDGFSFSRLEGAANHPCDLYERLVVMIDVSDTAFYLVDLFSVNGGDQHDQSWHAMLVEPEVPGLDWVAQETGTLAGPAVERFSAYTCRFGFHYRKGNFPSFLADIRRAPLAAPAVWTWRSGLPEGDALRLHVIPLGGAAEAVMGRGRSPAWPQDQALDFLLVRRQAPGGRASRFLSILDAYQDTPTVSGIAVLSEAPLQLRVSRTGGEDLVTIHVPEGPSRTTGPRPVGVRVRSLENGQVTRDVRIGHWDGRPEVGSLRARIAATDHATMSLTADAADDAFARQVAPGTRVRIYNDRRTAQFEVARVDVIDAGLRLTLKHTAELSRFVVEGVENGALRIRNRGPFVTGHLTADGRPSDRGHDLYHGARLGDAPDAPIVEGVSNSQPPAIHLVEALPDDVLRERYLGREVPLYEYHVGDWLEVIRVED